MSKSLKKGLVPHLRFPEFKSAKSWEVSCIDEVAQTFSGGTPATGRKEYYGGDIPFIRSAEINSKNTELFLTEEGLKNSSAKMVEVGDVLYALYGANSGDVAISKINGAINQAILCIKAKNKNKHIYQFLSHRKEAILSRYLQGGQGNLSGEIVKSIQIPLPSEEKELLKVSDCLSSLDDLLTAQGEKVEALKTYKKGLLQQLFPQEGETVPHLRFPEFKNDGDWEILQLSTISERITEKVGHQKLTTVSITAGTGFVSQVEKFSRDISGKQYQNYIVLKKGEFSYNKGNSKKFPQGCIYKLIEFEKVAAPNAFISFRLKEGFVADFYQAYFENNYHGKQLKKFITSGARSDGLLNINADDFFNITFPTPKNINEQIKIAEFIGSFNSRIEQEAKILKNLKLHKKGLLQELFPNIEEWGK
ncbi:restriction endonuclease subunit S [Bdellovibrio bacteriovorus]|uniref:restriction endonuclease subunit S n=1 Tax=Bdellovibrio bacteriovorus TaxID=959 RepID=UPI0035A5A9C2